MKRSVAGVLMIMALGLAYAKDKPMHGVNEKIAVASRGGKVLVTLTVSNKTAQAIYLWKVIYASEQLFGPEFDIKVAGSAAPVNYMGPVVKRAPPGPDDYVKVEPNGVHRNTIDITRSYDFLPGKHRYQLSHTGSYVPDLQHLTDPVAMKPGSTVFTHTQVAQPAEQ
ncbi:hypothetical protein IV454_00925 [Massilia antarctica]|uniref:Extracellular protease n=1 Tax=Massilia antarctica TaxID=2765360 RepID=A0AA49A883_9BURK|nr:hypothetical protein [Massilia antarctica]QPI50238.1 hypothetical protein IV454_00925 [Massilia antarctica]